MHSLLSTPLRTDDASREPNEALGHRSMLVNDVYDVVHRAVLDRRLEEQPDMIGDAEGWSRLEDPDTVMTRAPWAVSPRRGSPSCPTC